MAADLSSDKFWVTKTLYHDAEKKYHENLTKLLKKGQGRLEGRENFDLANNEKIKKNKSLREKNIVQAVKKEPCKSKAQWNFYGNVGSDTLNCVTSVLNKGESEYTKNSLVTHGKFSAGNICNPLDA